jgi:hypothetical protein
MSSAPNLNKKAFLLFHLNLSFSSIESNDHAKLIKNCYWPLLKLVSSSELKTGIEISGSSLKKISELDPLWIEEFSRLHSKGLLELIGSGAYQVIGPLIPYEINLLNQILGLKIYKKILGVAPTSALVNEMAFSSGVVDFYNEAGFETVLMERNNAALALNKSLREVDEIKFLQGTAENKIKVLWTDSIMFQRLQRYIHNDISLSTYYKDLNDYHAKFTDTLPIYSNDAEVFNFRPGRFSQEAKIEYDEWDKIQVLLNALSQNGLEFKLPHEITNSSDYLKNQPSLNITSCSYPAIVKKQPKYNITRWALTGRDDIWINTMCYRIFEQLPKFDDENIRAAGEKLLCELWSSDLRTHITERRWIAAREKIFSFCGDAGIDTDMRLTDNAYLFPNDNSDNQFSGTIEKDVESRMIIVKTRHLELSLNPFKGLCIESLKLYSQHSKKIIGSLPAHHFDNIELGADFYSGGLIVDIPEKRKRLTDYCFVNPNIKFHKHSIEISAEFSFGDAMMTKSLIINDSDECIVMQYRFLNWDQVNMIARVGNFIFMEEGFQDNMFYKTTAGGKNSEIFPIDRVCDHTQPISSLISSTTCIPSSTGEIIVGSASNALLFSWNMAQAAALPMLLNKESHNARFTRLIFSLSEIDDTSKNQAHLPDFEIKISPI